MNNPATTARDNASHCEVKCCARCGAGFSRPKGYSSTTWAARKFCGGNCALQSRRPSLAQKISSRYEIDTKTGCWNWTGNRLMSGYGIVLNESRKALCAHRVSYEIHNGPIPDGLEIDHLCRNRGCINPLHLEAVTSAENTRRGQAVAATKVWNAARTHCKRGHPFSGKNLRINGDGSRTCRECQRTRQSR